MALCKRNKIWWIRFSHNGIRIQQSTGTSDRQAAQELHDQLKVQVWRQSKLQEKPQKTWMDAVIRWLNESQHKRSLDDDKMHLRWLDPYLKEYFLNDITRDLVEELAKKREATGVKASTVNRMLAVIRAILRKATQEWEWLDKTPAIRMRKEQNHRIRWLSEEEAKRLLSLLPPHLAAMAAFSLATGLRESNVRHLQWKDVSLVNRHALVHADEAKAKKAIPVPLNETAIAILKQQMGMHEQYVFTYRGHPVGQCNTKAWRKALKRVGIESFRWHDLRHTWASWHVQNGTTLQELQQMGGWASYQMVLRYAHLSSNHLMKAAERISGVKMVERNLKVVRT